MSVHNFQRRIRAADLILRTGRVRKILATYIEADGPNVPLGTVCAVEAQSPSGPVSFEAEVVRVDATSVVLTPLDHGVPTFAGARVTAIGRVNTVPVGRAFLGRAVDAAARPIDALGEIPSSDQIALFATAIPPLQRTSPAEPLETGIRAIDSLLTLGKGQRVGVFAASGVGKTSLLNQIANHANADVSILCLVGERGREVEATWTQGLNPRAKSRTTLVAATSDQSAAMRVRAAQYSLALAEYWRARGKHVLLFLDSITRLAMAMREMGLAAGEPPTVRAYTPGVFAAIPRIVERCGALKSGGAITAIMTVLSETDDIDDPICELMKSLLDGHIVLSRTLAEQGHFPAIDVLRSVSRQAENLVPSVHRAHAQQIHEWLSLREASRTLIDAGLYVAGSNGATDRAVQRYPEIVRFLRQDRSERVDLNAGLAAMDRLIEGVN